VSNAPTTGHEGDGLFAPLRRGTRVQLDLPDGTRGAFTFAPRTETLAGQDVLRPAWVPDDTVAGWTLATDEVRLIEKGGRFYVGGSNVPYNPASPGNEGTDYRLTGPGGTEWHIDAARGLTRIERPDGNRVYVSDGGIYGTDGTAVTFRRDPQGRITRIEGPDLSRSYRYGPNGTLDLGFDLQSGQASRFGYDVNDRLVLSVVGDGTGQHWLDGAPSPLLADLGGLADLGTRTFTLDGEGTLALSLTPGELSSTASGSVFLRANITGNAEMTLAGRAAVSETINATGRTAIFELTEAGLTTLRLAGDGDVTLDLAAVGDLDSDADVDAADSAVFGAGRDLNGDNTTDRADRALFNAMFGLVPNGQPAADPNRDALKTWVDLPLGVVLADQIVDPDGDPVLFTALDAEGGTVWMTGPASALFTPTPGRTETATIRFGVTDGFGPLREVVLPVEISDAPLLSLDFENREIVFDAAGQFADISLLADFADAQDVRVPSQWAGVTLDDNDSVTLDGGRLTADAPGHDVLRAQRGVIGAATAVGVFDTTDAEALLTFVGGIDAYPDAVTLLPAGGTRQIVTTLGTLGQRFVGDAADGTRYQVGDSRILSVGEDGVMTALTPGETTVTVIHAYGEETLRVRVAAPLAEAKVSAEGGIVEAPGGVSLGFAPGAFEEETDVTVQSLAVDTTSTSAQIPDVFEPFAAFEFDHSGDLNADAQAPVQIAIEAPGLAVGDEVAFFSKVELPTDPNGEMEVHWGVFDTGVVGEDGIARSTSPPFPGLTDRGQVLAARQGMPMRPIVLQPAAVVEAGILAGMALSFAPFGLAGLMVAGPALATSALTILAPAVKQSVNFIAYREYANREITPFAVNSELDAGFGPAFVEFDVPDDPLEPRSVDDEVASAAYGDVQRPDINVASLVDSTNLFSSIKLEGTLFMDDAFLLERNGEFSAEDLRDTRIRIRFQGEDRFVYGADYTDTSITANGGDARFTNTIEAPLPTDILLGASLFYVERLLDPGAYPPDGPWPQDAAFIRSQPVRLSSAGGLAFVSSRPRPGEAASVYIDVVERGSITEGTADKVVQRIPLPGNIEGDRIIDLVTAPNDSALYVLTPSGVRVFDTIAMRFVDLDRDDGPFDFIGVPGGRVADFTIAPDGSALYVGARDKVYRIELRRGQPDYLRAKAIGSVNASYTDLDALYQDVGLPPFNQIQEVALNADGTRLFVLAPIYPDGNSLNELDRETKGEIYVFDVDPEKLGETDEVDGVQLPAFGRRLKVTGVPPEEGFDTAGSSYSERGNLVVQWNPKYISRTNDPDVMLLTAFGDSTDGLKRLRIVKDDGDEFEIRMERVMATIEAYQDQELEALNRGLVRNQFDAWGYNKEGVFRFFPQIGSSRQDYDLDIQTATDVVITPDASYAFVADAGTRPWFSTSNLIQIENQTQVGGKIGIIQDPLGLNAGPRFLGSTTPLPRQWIREIALSSDGTRLYVALTNADNVLVYDVENLKRAANNSGNAINLRRLPVDHQGPGGQPLAGVQVNLPGIDINSPRQIALNRRTTLALDPPSRIVVHGDNTDELTLGFEFNTQDLPPNLRKARLFISQMTSGLGLFPGDAPSLLDREGTFKEEIADWNPGRIFTTAKDEALTAGHSYRVTATGTIVETGRLEDENRVEVTFDERFSEVLTSGQTYYWGIQIDGSSERTASTFQTAARPAEGVYGPVTLLSHGFQFWPTSLTGFLDGNLEQPEEIENLARLIARSSGGATILSYDKATGDWVDRISGKRNLDALEPGKPVILLSDWVKEADISDEGFSEAAADSIFASLMALDIATGGDLLKSPLHFIGHNRGAVVNSEMIQRLGIYRPGVTDVHMTTLDPFDQKQESLKIPFKDVVLLGKKINDALTAATATATAVSTVLGGGAVTAGAGATAVIKQRALSKAIEKVIDFADALGVKISTIDWDDFKDPDVKRWSNVRFADNYFQSAAKVKRDSNFDFDANLNSSDDVLAAAQEFGSDSFNTLLDKLGVPGPFTFSANGRSTGTEWNVDMDLTKYASGFDEDDITLPGGLSFGFGGPTDRILSWYAGTVHTGITRFGDSAIYRTDRDIGQQIISLGYVSDQRHDAKGWYSVRPVSLRNSTALRGIRNDVLSAAKDNSPVPGVIQEGTGQGWFYSTSGGGDPWRHGTRSATRYPATFDNSEQGKIKDQAVPKIFNGNFEHGTKQSLFNLLLSKIDIDAFLEARRKNQQIEGGEIDSTEKEQELRKLLSGSAADFGRFPLSYELPGWSFHGGEGFTAGLGEIDGVPSDLSADVAGLFLTETNLGAVFGQMLNKVGDVLADKLFDAAFKHIQQRLILRDYNLPDTPAWNDYILKQADTKDTDANKKATALLDAFKLVDGLLQTQEVKEFVLSRKAFDGLIEKDKPVSLEELVKIGDDGKANPFGIEAARAYVKEGLKYYTTGKGSPFGQSDMALLMGGQEVLKTALKSFAEFNPITGAVGNLIGGFFDTEELIDQVVDQVASFDRIVHNRFYVPETGANFISFDTITPVSLTGARIEYFLIEQGTNPDAVVDENSPGVVDHDTVTMETGLFSKTQHIVQLSDRVEEGVYTLMFRQVGFEEEGGLASLIPPSDGSSEAEAISAILANGAAAVDSGAQTISQLFFLDNITLLASADGAAQEATGAQDATAGTELTLAEAKDMAGWARAIWEESGLTPDGAEAALDRLSIRLGDLPGTLLAQHEGDVLTLDRDGAGAGWFVDPTPQAHEEFRTDGADWLLRGETGIGYDLLTVIAHEMGHAIGLADVALAEAPERLMSSVLGAGTRRLPSTSDLIHRTRAGATFTGLQAANGTPVNTAFVNGDFSVASGPGLGWDLTGAARVENGVAMMDEGANSFTGLSQSVLKTAGARSMAFTLSDITLGAEQGRVPDALQVVLQDETTGQPVSRLQGLAGTDALLSVQADGRVFFGPRVRITGVATSGDMADLSRPLEVTVDLAGIAADTALRLGFDLLGFGSQDASYKVDDVRIGTASVNTAPVAVDDQVSAIEDTPLTFDPRDNDSDPENDPLSISITQAPASGTLSLEPGGALRYVPEADFAGQVDFTYEVSDGTLSSAPARVVIEVAARNDAPVLAPVVDGAVIEGEVFATTLAATDVDDTTNDLQFALIDGPTGMQMDTQTGALSWTAPDGQSGHDVTVRVTDAAGAIAEQSFRVSVSDAAPHVLLTGPATATDGEPYTVRFGVTDPGDDTVSEYVIDWGDGSPPETFAGSASEATHVYTGSRARDITLGAVNEDGRFAAAPLTVSMAASTPDLRPVADRSLREGDTLNLTLVASDPDTPGADLRFALVDGPSGMQVEAQSGALTWTAPDGPDRQNVTVAVNDPQGNRAETSFVISVINVAPDLTVTGPFSARPGLTHTIAIGHTDPGQDTAQRIVVNWGDGSAPETRPGTATGASHVYTATGTFNITVTLHDEDGAYAAPALPVSVRRPAASAPQVTGLDTAPDRLTVRFDRALDPTSVTARSVNLRDENRMLAGSVSLAPDGLSLDFQPDTPLKAGSYALTLAGGPDGRAAQTQDAIRGKTGSALDGDGNGTAGGDVILPVHISAGMTVPVAADDSARTRQDQPIVLSPLDNDSDAGDDPLSMRLLDQPDGGAARINPDGTLTFTPHDGFSGTTRMSYVATDGEAESQPAEISVTVEPRTTTPASTAGGRGTGRLSSASFGAPASPSTSRVSAPVQLNQGPGAAIGTGVASSSVDLSSIDAYDSCGPVLVGEVRGWRISLPADIEADQPVTLGLSRIDNDAAPIRGWVIDWGDGSSPQDAPAGAPPPEHAYDSDGIYRVRVRIVTDNGVIGTALMVVVGPRPILQVQDVTVSDGTFVVKFTHDLDLLAPVTEGAITLLDEAGRVVPGVLNAGATRDTLLFRPDDRDAMLQPGARLRIGAPGIIEDVLQCRLDGDGDGVPGGVFQMDLPLPQGALTRNIEIDGMTQPLGDASARDRVQVIAPEDGILRLVTKGTTLRHAQTGDTLALPLGDGTIELPVRAGDPVNIALSQPTGLSLEGPALTAQMQDSSDLALAAAMMAPALGQFALRSGPTKRPGPQKSATRPSSGLNGRGAMLRVPHARDTITPDV